MPAVPAAGVPASTPVAGVKFMPVGRVPDSILAGAGKPLAVSVNVHAAATTQVVLFALVIAGASLTVNVNP